MNRQQKFTTLTLLLGLAAAPMHAQQGPPPRPPQSQGGPPPYGGPPPRGPGQRGPGQRGLGQGGRDGRPGNPSADMEMPPGRWWNDANIAQTVGLSAAQIKKMDDTFSGARDHLIDLDGAVRKAENDLQPLVESDPIDRAKIMAQMDRLTQAKAELEKANVQMLVDIRLQLTHDQWVKLSGTRPPRPPER